MASEDVLAGNATATYVRMSPATLMLSGPVIGLLYAILMPFIGMTAAATLAVRKVLEVSTARLPRASSSDGSQETPIWRERRKRKKKRMNDAIRHPLRRVRRGAG